MIKLATNKELVDEAILTEHTAVDRCMYDLTGMLL